MRKRKLKGFKDERREQEVPLKWRDLHHNTKERAGIYKHFPPPKADRFMGGENFLNIVGTAQFNMIGRKSPFL